MFGTIPFVVLQFAITLCVCAMSGREVRWSYGWCVEQRRYTLRTSSGVCRFHCYLSSTTCSATSIIRPWYNCYLYIAAY